MKFTKPFLLLCLGGFAASTLAQQQIPLDTATINRLGIVYQAVAAPESGDGARFAATVIASPQAMSELHAMSGGVLEGWQVQPGQSVTAGQLLAVLRSDTLAALQQDWVNAAAQADLTAQALKRDQALLKDGIIAQQRLQATEREAAAAAFEASSLASRLERNGYGNTELAALRSGKGSPGRYYVKAPAAGLVTHLRHVTGDLVDEGEILLTIAGDQLWVTAEIPARLATQLAVGQTLQLVDHNASLTVRQLDQAVDPATQTLGLLADFAGTVPLLPGQVVSVILPARDAGVVIPAEAVVRNGEERVVFVRSGNGVESRVLNLKPLGADYLATTGLNAGEQVVVRGAAILKGITLGLGGE
jgi:cobalt-zinc-cadmium efflux system membrane fusion protein